MLAAFSALTLQLGDRKGIWSVKRTPQQCSWFTITAWWQHAVRSQEHCHS